VTGLIEIFRLYPDARYKAELVPSLSMTPSLEKRLLRVKCMTVASVAGPVRFWNLLARVNLKCAVVMPKRRSTAVDRGETDLWFSAWANKN